MKYFFTIALTLFAFQYATATPDPIRSDNLSKACLVDILQNKKNSQPCTLYVREQQIDLSTQRKQMCQDDQTREITTQEINDCLAKHELLKILDKSLTAEITPAQCTEQIRRLNCD